MDPEGSQQLTHRDLSERSRLWQLVFAIWVSFANSVGIGGYTSPILKAAPYNFSQGDLALLGAIAGIFVSVSLPAGWLFDRVGPSACLRVGAVLALIAHGWAALMFFGRLPLNLASMTIMSCISAQAYTFFENGSFVPNLSMFARDKGTILLLEEGLGSAIVASWYVGFMREDTHTLILLAVLLQPVVGLAASFAIRKPSIPEDDIPWHGHRRFVLAYVIMGATLALYTTTDLVSNFLTLPHAVRVLVAAFGVLAVTGYAAVPLLGNGRGYKDPSSNFSLSSLGSFDLAASPTQEPPPHWGDGQLDPVGCVPPTEAPAVRTGPGGPTVPEGGMGNEEANEKATLLPRPSAAVNTGEDESGAVTGVPRSISLRQALCTPELWLLFAVSTVQWGVTNAIGGNQPQIYQALNNGELDRSVNAVYISISSIFAALGRCTVAVLDAKVHNKAKILMWAPPLFAVAAALIAWVPVKGLVVPFALSAFADQISWAARALTLKQLFHGRHFGLIFNFMYSLAVASPFVFNVGLFASVYDNEARRLGTYPACPERSCVSTQMYVLAGLSVGGSIAGAIVYRRVEVRLKRREQLRAAVRARLLNEQTSN